MMLTSIGATQDKPGAVEFSLNLEEVFIVESQTAKGLHPDLKQQPQKVIWEELSLRPNLPILSVKH